MFKSSVIYYDAQTSIIKYLQNLPVAVQKLFSSERPLFNMGMHCGRSHKVFWWKEKLYKSELYEFENYESLDEKDTSRNVWQQLVNI